MKQTLKRIIRTVKSVKGNSLAEFATTTALMATLAATAAPKLSEMSEGAKAEKSRNELDKLVKQAGAWYTFVDQNGDEHKFQSKDFGALISDVETQEYIYDSICEKIILKYDSGQLGIDDVTTEAEFADE